MFACCASGAGSSAARKGAALAVAAPPAVDRGLPLGRAAGPCAGRTQQPATPPAGAAAGRSMSLVAAQRLYVQVAALKVGPDGPGVPATPRDVYRALHAVYHPAGAPHSPVVLRPAPPVSKPAGSSSRGGGSGPDLVLGSAAEALRAVLALAAALPAPLQPVRVPRGLLALVAVGETVI